MKEFHANWKTGMDDPTNVFMILLLSTIVSAFGMMIHPFGTWSGILVLAYSAAYYHEKNNNKESIIKELDSERVFFRTEASVLIRIVKNLHYQFEISTVGTKEFWDLYSSSIDQWINLKNSIERISEVWPKSEVVNLFNRLDSSRFNDREKSLMLFEQIENELKYFADGHRGEKREVECYSCE